MSRTKLSLEQKTLDKNWEKYRGYTVLIIDDKIYAAKKASLAKKYFDMIIKKYHRSPLITVIPDADTLILIAL